MNTKIVVGCNKKKIEIYRRLCEKRKYDADVQILEMKTNMAQNQDYKNADIILISIETIGALLRYIFFHNQIDKSKVILVVNCNISFLNYLGRGLKSKVIYSNDYKMDIIENLLDIIAYKKPLQIKHTDLLNASGPTGLRGEYYEGNREMLLEKAELDWSKNILEKCRIINFRGDFEINIASDIFEWIQFTNDVQFDCNYRADEPIGVFILWVIN